MQMSEIITSDYKKRLDLLDVTIKEKETKIQDIEKDLVDLSKRSKEKNLVSIEPVFEGDFVSVYKKGNVVRFFPKEKEIPSISDSLFALSKEDFIINGISTKQEDKSLFYVTDCFYLKQDLGELSFKDRKRALDSLNYSDLVKQNGCVLVENQEDATKAIELVSKTDNVIGVLVKDYSKSNKATIVYNK